MQPGGLISTASEGFQMRLSYSLRQNEGQLFSDLTKFARIEI
jgi:hypothetical protein